VLPESASVTSSASVRTPTLTVAISGTTVTRPVPLTLIDRTDSPSAAALDVHADSKPKIIRLTRIKLNFLFILLFLQIVVKRVCFRLIDEEKEKNVPINVIYPYFHLTAW
jgi:hypothetical protein